MKKDIKKYIYAFIITSIIFVTAFYLGDYFSNKKLDVIKSAENRIAVDILSSETQFSLLGELSCKDAENSTLPAELDSLGERLNYSEQKIGANDPEFIDLKKYYSLLEIKNYVLLKKLRDCPKPQTIILYFYSSDCPDCDREGYVLTRLKQQYPELRVYSFDYNLDLSALKTLASVYNIGKTLPAVVIKNKAYEGFQSLETLKSLMPELKMGTSTKNSN